MRRIAKSIQDSKLQMIEEEGSCCHSAAVSADYLVVSYDTWILDEEPSEHSEITVYDLRAVTKPTGITYPHNMRVVDIVDGKLIGVNRNCRIQMSLPDCRSVEFSYAPSAITGIDDQWYTTIDGAFVGPDVKHVGAYRGDLCEVVSVGNGAIIFNTESEHNRIFAVGASVTHIPFVGGIDHIHRGKSEIFIEREASISKFHLNASKSLLEVMLETDDTLEAVAHIDDNIVVFTTTSEQLCVADLRCKTTSVIFRGEQIFMLYSADGRIIGYRTGGNDGFVLLM